MISNVVPLLQVGFLSLLLWLGKGPEQSFPLFSCHQTIPITMAQMASMVSEQAAPSKIMADAWPA